MPAYRPSGVVGDLLGVVRATLSSDLAAMSAVARLSAKLLVHHALARQHVGLLSLSLHRCRRTWLSACAAQRDLARAGIYYADGRVHRLESPASALGCSRAAAGGIRKQAVTLGRS